MSGFESAKKAAYDVVELAWNSACQAVCGSQFPIAKDRLVQEIVPDGIWGRVIMIEGVNAQDGFIASASKAYRSQGALRLEITAPVRPAINLAYQDSIAAAVRDHLRTTNIVTPDGCRIVLNGIRIIPVPSEQTVVRLDIRASYTYRERVS